MANARSARAGRVWIAGATRRALTATPCRARHWSMMAYTPRISERCGSSTPCRRRHSRSREFGQPRIPRPFAIVATLLFLCTGAAAHPPEAEFGDWFRSLKEPGTEGTVGSGTSCCSPASELSDDRLRHGRRRSLLDLRRGRADSGAARQDPAARRQPDRARRRLLAP